MLQLRDYQEEAKGAILQYPVGILEALTGCLTGDTIVRLNRAGKGFSCTLKKLYEGFNNCKEIKSRPWNLSIPTKIRSFNHDENQINWVPVKLEDVSPAKLNIKVGKAIIEIESGFDEKLLQSVVRSLEAIC
jgi:hypothetical protein